MLKKATGEVNIAKNILSRMPDDKVVNDVDAKRLKIVYEALVAKGLSRK